MGGGWWMEEPVMNFEGMKRSKSMGMREKVSGERDDAWFSLPPSSSLGSDYSDHGDFGTNQVYWLTVLELG
jgi:hypothetical protein